MKPKWLPPDHSRKLVAIVFIVFLVMFAIRRGLYHSLHFKHRLVHPGVLSMSTDHRGDLLEMVRSIVPPLTYDRHKGQAGRVGVVGGCQEYTGAPYFAGIAALKSGADLAHVFCTSDAATVIKSYSPELIVHPLLDKQTGVAEMSTWMERLHTLVVGPGMGREQHIMDNVKGVIAKARQLSIPVVIDADGLWLVTVSPEVITGYNKAILTPNIVEFNRLFQAMLGKQPDKNASSENVKQLSQAMGNLTIVQKGQTDVISNGDKVLPADAEGSPCRAGGQGDILSGAMGVFTFWGYDAVRRGVDNPLLKEYGPSIAAAYGASTLTKTCSRLAFSKWGRSMGASDLIPEIHPVFEELFEMSGPGTPIQRL
ncbi:ATP-dependent (S)-NAD(P)H-hydrate dehydratase-like [Branchiostoma floridae x Branchiostoma belcheri]